MLFYFGYKKLAIHFKEETKKQKTKGIKKSTEQCSQ